MSFKTHRLSWLSLLLLVPALAMADADRNYKVAPNLFKTGAAMENIADMAIVKGGVRALSETPTIPLKANTMYLRHKKGPKEYHWFSGQVDEKNFEKLHAFSLRENYLKASEVVGMRFYGSQKNKAFQDELDLYFDREYIYSPRVPKLFFMKNGRWQQLNEVDRPGIIIIDTAGIPGLEYTSLTLKMRNQVSKIYPVKSGMYAFSFSAPNRLPYVEAVYVQDGEVLKIKPQMAVLANDGKVTAKTSVTLGAVESANTLEEVEVLFDKLAADIQNTVSLVDTTEFAKSYPAPRKALSLSVTADDDSYKDYRAKFQVKRQEARDMWRSSKLGGIGMINQVLRHKLDSLQKLPLSGTMQPTKVEPVYQKVDGTDQIAAVRMTFGQPKARFDVSWSGTAEGMTNEEFYNLVKDGDAKAHLTLVNNKPVWIYDQGVLTGRHHYRYEKMELNVNGSDVQTHGGFELPDYIFDQTEVQEWLNRPAEEKTQVLTEEVEKKAPVQEDEDLGVEVKMSVPRVIRDKIVGNVALIDSGSFRYRGHVVAMSPFAIHTTEVTQQFFKETMDRLDSSQRIEDRSSFKEARKPVHNINWDNARKFCKAIGGDLPTEAQWEFAGRADNNEGALWNLDDVPDVNNYAVYRKNSYKLGKKSPLYGPQPVSAKKSNPWGIFDMSGNVAEWTLDNYFMFSFIVEKSNPTGATMGSHKVYKGGSWKDNEKDLNLTERDDEDPRFWSDAIGFRCAFPRAMFEGK
ncbi:MAG: formylglycine-generating enzyme family protein [Fibrobacter sp.]|nr:formylglycine-generating enzyme family protein [Fibrobacter sp.]